MTNNSQDNLDSSVSRISPFADFFKRESSSGILIVFASILGLIIANSPLSKNYFEILKSKLSFDLGFFAFEMDVSHLINDGLMTIFFLVVGLEIKRELSSGHLSNIKSALLPLLAAIGGMLIPAVIYLMIAGDSNPTGWAIPVATDIALALGVLSLVSTKNNATLRPFLLGLAVIDDIGAILIIAVFFSVGIKLNWLLAVLVVVGIVIALKYLKVQYIFVYVFLGVILWFSLYEAGIHPTIAGVILGLLAPSNPFVSKEYIDTEELLDLSTVENVIKTKKIAKGSVSVVEWLEHQIHPWTAFLIVPLFAFVNSGIVITSQSISNAINSPVAWAIFFGLVAGKPLGIFLFTFVSLKTNIGALSGKVRWSEIFATGSSAGIGFTVSIFIAKLAFEDETLQSLAIFSVLIASVTSALLSYLLFKVLSFQNR
jgi:NhaA family Na+:H+ antiporter